MPGIKISALPPATLPLSGNELVPLVQGGVTKRATVNDSGGNAINTKFTPAGTIAATNVQAAIQEVAAEAGASGTAAGTAFTPAGTIASTNVQAAIQELDTETVKKTGSTGSALMPYGTTSERDNVPAVAALRFNTTLQSWEFGNGSTWLLLASSISANSVPFTPYGPVTNTNVQGAIQQLQDLKVAKAGDTMTGNLLGPLAIFNTFQIGRYPTNTDNFAFGAVGSGVLKLSRGADGFPVADVMVVDATNNVTFSGDVTAFSDERLKTNWQTYEQDFIDRLAAVKSGTFERVHTGQRQVGVSAQSLQDLMPEAVHTGEDGFLSVAYGNAALAACVELAKEIKVLRARLEQVEGML